MVDMCVDYLWSGRGMYFIVMVVVIWKGSKLVVCRMELYNEVGDYIVFGMGIYMLG